MINSHLPLQAGLSLDRVCCDFTRPNLGGPPLSDLLQYCSVLPAKQFFQCLNLPGYNVWPLPFAIPSVTTKKSLALSSFQLQFNQLQPAIRSPLSLLSTRLKSRSLLHHLKHVLHVPDHPCSPLVRSLPISECPPDLEGPKPDTVFQV